MTRDMTKGPIAPLVIRFSLSMLAGFLFQQLYNMVDTVIVGRYVGVMALAGVGSTGSVNFLVLGFCMGVCQGFAIPVGQCFGAGNEEHLRKHVANGIWIAGAIAIVMTVLTVVLCRNILVWMNTPEECFEEAYLYIVVIFAGIPCTVAYNLLSGWLRALGDSRSPFLFLLISSVLNIVLDLFFIIVCQMGVLGASLATVISQGVSCLLCLWWVKKKFPILHLSRENKRFDKRCIQNLCGFGFPMAFQYSITAIGCVMLQTAMNGLGPTSLAAISAGNKLSNLVVCPFDAFGVTMATFGAQNVGAGRYERLGKGLFLSNLYGFVYSAFIFVLIWLFGESALGIFISKADQTAELLQLAHRYLLLSAAFYPLLSLINTVRYMIQGMGFSVFAVYAGVLEMVGRAAVAIWLVPLWGFTGAALGNAAAWILADAFLVPAFFRCRRVLVRRAEQTQKGGLLDAHSPV